MATSLTIIGVAWAFLSMTSALAACIGFYFPYWIQGVLLNKTDAFFGSFRRCNYPRLTADGSVEIVMECGRYSSFWDIPSIWWQAGTIAAGIGSALALLVGVTAAAACCMTQVIHTGTARAAGFLQLLSGLLIFVGLAVYPMGWKNKEVMEACGSRAGAYNLGNCKLSWSSYLLASGAGSLLVCFLMSFKASRVKPGSFRI